MADIEKVTDALEHCEHCACYDCPYNENGKGGWNCRQMHKDALELLEEQKKTIEEFRGFVNKLNTTTDKELDNLLFIRVPNFQRALIDPDMLMNAIEFGRITQIKTPRNTYCIVKKENKD